jgi:hypothetical protein
VPPQSELNKPPSKVMSDKRVEISEVIRLLQSNSATSLKWVGNVLTDDDSGLIKTLAEALKANTSVTAVDISGNTLGGGVSTHTVTTFKM